MMWPVCVYVSAPRSGDLNNFLMLLDDFFVYKEKAMAREQPSTWMLTACAGALHAHGICLCLEESSQV